MTDLNQFVYILTQISAKYIQYTECVQYNTSIITLSPMRIVPDSGYHDTVERHTTKYGIIYDTQVSLQNL